MPPKPTTRRREATGESADAPNHKPIRRPRPFLNCAECRRLKTKCDRQVPCGSCVKRGCARICPQRTLGSIKNIRQRVSQLEQTHAISPEDEQSGLEPEDGGVSPQRDRAPGSQQVSDTFARPVAVNRVRDPDPPRPEAGDEAESAGTLVVNPDGSTKFIGQSASFQWIRDETKEQPGTRPQSPQRQSLRGGFPFHTHQPIAPATLLSYLPPQDEAVYLVGCFQRHIAWNGPPILEDDLMSSLQWLYGLESIPAEQTNMALQLLALLFIVLALGSMLNLEVSADDSACMDFYRLSQQCLVSGDFLVGNTLATVQALSLMAKFTAYAGMRDVAWQIRGMATRIILAMGLHRDGKTWGLSPKDLNNRRRTFWETYSTDVLISSNWARPAGLQPDMFDTELPQDYYDEGMGFEKQRCRMSMLAQEALQESLKVRSDYGKLREIWRRMLQVESETPYALRNRTSLSLKVSKYASLAEVEADTPPMSRNLRVVMQCHDLIDIASTIIMTMFRPYFVEATQSPNPTSSPYAEAYLAVFERSSMLIANVMSLHSNLPLVSTRHWFFWNHSFSAAVSLATICIASPGSSLVNQALHDINSMISLYSTVQSAGPPKWVKRSLQWLLELKARAHEKINAYRAGELDAQDATPGSTSEDTAEHLLLVGWKKRLVELSHRAPVPEPDVPQTSPALEELGLDNSDDVLNQLLGLSAEGPQFPQFMPSFMDTSMMDFGFDIQ